jgi:hypothetical protein
MSSCKEPLKLFEESESLSRPRSSKINMGIGPLSCYNSNQRFPVDKKKHSKIHWIEPENRLLRSPSSCNDGRENRETGMLPSNEL